MKLAKYILGILEIKYPQMYPPARYSLQKNPYDRSPNNRTRDRRRGNNKRKSGPKRRR